jgi:hypothetical protein
MIYPLDQEVRWESRRDEPVEAFATGICLESRRQQICRFGADASEWALLKPHRAYVPTPKTRPSWNRIMKRKNRYRQNRYL